MLSPKQRYYRLTRTFHRRLWRKTMIFVIILFLTFCAFYKDDEEKQTNYFDVKESIILRRSLLFQTNESISTSESTTITNSSLAKKEKSFESQEDKEVKKEVSKLPPDLFTEEQRRNGFVVFHILGMVYMFIALAVVCDEFFIPALDVITEKLKISEDVAGATFMAAGGSAPELFTSIIGVFVTFDDVGIGTIVGSAVFNILFVLSMCAIFSKTVLDLTWWPLFRDVSFYSLILISLMLCFKDSMINWFEAFILLSWYAAYVIFMKYNETTELFVKKLLAGSKVNNEAEAINADMSCPQHRKMSTPILHGGSKFRKGVMHLMIHSIDPLHGEVIKNAAKSHPQSMTKNRHIHPNPGNTSCKLCNEMGDSNGVNGNDVFHTNKLASNHNNSNSQSNNNPLENSANDLMDDSNSINQEEKEPPLDVSWPDSWRKQLTYISLAPIIIPLWLTLPDVRRPEKKKWFPCSFIGSILWIAIYSYLMVWWATLVGETFYVGSEIMGLTFLAAGTSIPDLITSVLVARKGFGDMAVSSSIGSNIFDVTVGLPFPWFLYTIIFGPVQVNSTGMACSILILFIMLMFVILTIALFKWKLNIGMAIVMFFLYFVFIACSLVLERGIVQCSSIINII